MKTIYVNLLSKSYGSLNASFRKTNFSTRHLEERLLSTFKRKINVISFNNNKIVKPYSGVFLDNNLIELETQDILQRAAIILRDEVLKIKANKLPDKLTSNDLITGECSVPKTVNDFS